MRKINKKKIYIKTQNNVNTQFWYLTIISAEDMNLKESCLTSREQYFKCNSSNIYIITVHLIYCL